MATPEEQQQSLNLKIGNVPVAIQSTSLALIFGVGAMVWSNFGTLQDRVADTSASQIVIEQRLEAVKKQLDVIDIILKEQDTQRSRQSEIAAKLELFEAKTEMRLTILETALDKKKKP
jgi:cell division protein FtsX